jgi:cell wall-associated NlpC family hydrolase
MTSPHAKLAELMNHIGRQPTELGLRARWLATLLQAAGAPYTWGGASLAEGFDCSGLMYWALARHGRATTRKSGRWLWLDNPHARIPVEDATSGDLVFYGSGPTTPDGNWVHVDVLLTPGVRLGALGKRNEKSGNMGGSVRLTAHRRDDAIAALSIARILA